MTTIISEGLKNSIDCRLEQIWEENNKEFPKLDYDTMSRFLKLTGGFATGSFILQCLLGEKYINSDIDIFIPINTTVKQKISSFVNFFPGVKNSKNCCYSVADASSSEPIKEVVDLTNKVQLIFVDIAACANIVQFCQGYFDLTICSNGITHDKLFFSKDGEDLMLKKTTTVLLKEPIIGEFGFFTYFKNKERIAKYLARGYTIIGLDIIKKKIACIDFCFFCKDVSKQETIVHLKCGHTFHINCWLKRSENDKCSVDRCFLMGL